MRSIKCSAVTASAKWRRLLAPLLAVLAVGLLASACGTYVIQPEAPVSTAKYEVWAMDQTNNIIHIINPQLEVVETVDLSEAGLERTHWINFTSDSKYAWIASTVSGNTAVIRAEDRQVIATFDTGPASHAADIYPDDSGVLVSVIKSGELVEIVADHAAETFSIGRILKIAEDPLVKSRADEFPSANPISSAFTQRRALRLRHLGSRPSEWGPGDSGLGVILAGQGVFAGRSQSESDERAIDRR